MKTDSRILCQHEHRTCPISVLLFRAEIQVQLFLKFIYVHNLLYFSGPISCILAAHRFVAYACLPYSLTNESWRWKHMA